MENQYLSKVTTWWSEVNYTPLQKKALAIIAILVVFISAAFISRGSSHEVVAAPKVAKISAPPQLVVVDVAGAVRKPGVYSLPLNARVNEAIKAAGGLKIGADPSDVNQARILNDGEQIYIPPATQSFTGSSRTTIRKSGPVMINRATIKEFESLDGIGPVLAARIVTYRKVNGPFTAIEDLLKVPGIGPSTFAKFKAKLRV
jgi:competence protein ComEA